MKRGKANMRKRANKQEFYLNDEELELLYKKWKPVE